MTARKLKYDDSLTRKLSLSKNPTCSYCKVFCNLVQLIYHNSLPYPFLGMMNLDLSKIPKDLLGEGQALNGDELSEDEDDINNFTAINQSSEKRKGEATKSQLGTKSSKTTDKKTFCQKSLNLLLIHWIGFKHASSKKSFVSQCCFFTL